MGAPAVSEPKLSEAHHAVRLMLMMARGMDGFLSSLHKAGRRANATISDHKPGGGVNDLRK
jgi:hypothetical protein